MNKIIKHRKIIVVTLVILSVLLGIFIFNKLSESNIKFLVNNADNLKFINYKTILFHIVLLSISFILAFFGIGIIFLLIYLFFEGVTIGFICSYFFTLYKIKGIFYFTIYFLIFKVILLFLFSILILKFLKIAKTMIKFIKKQNYDITKTIFNSLVICFLIIINDTFLLIIGKKILNIFSFVIK